MSHTSYHARLGKSLFLAVVLALAVASHGVAQDITGQWEMTMSFGGRPSYATLTISKAPDGGLTGTWGNDELSHVKFDGQRLTFTRTIRFGDQEFTMNYTGTLKDGRIAGLMSSDRGEFEVTGARVKPKSPALGQWAMQYRAGERDITGTLSISQKPDGSLEGKWTSGRGESQISSLSFQNGKLSFDRTGRYNDRESKSTFEGAVQGDKLAGVFKSERGEMPVTGERIGSALIGKWELTTTTDRGARTSTLTIYPDLTGRQESFGGEIPIKDLKLDGNQVTYALELGFGDRTFVIDYKLTLVDKTLTGQSSSERGTSDITGKKMETASPAIGTWEFTRQTQQGARTSTLKINPDMTGTYSMRDTEVPVTGLKVDGNQVSFRVVMKYNETEVPMEFKGQVEGGELKGEFTTSRGAREAVGKKVQ